MDVEHEVPATAHGVEVRASKKPLEPLFAALEDLPPERADPRRGAVVTRRIRRGARLSDELPCVFAVEADPDRSPRAEYPHERTQSGFRVRHVMQHPAREDGVEALAERVNVEEVALQEMHVPKPESPGHAGGRTRGSRG